MHYFRTIFIKTIALRQVKHLMLENWIQVKKMEITFAKLVILNRQHGRKV